MVRSTKILRPGEKIVAENGIVIKCEKYKSDTYETIENILMLLGVAFVLVITFGIGYYGGHKDGERDLENKIKKELEKALEDNPITGLGVKKWVDANVPVLHEIMKEKPPPEDKKNEKSQKK